MSRGENDEALLDGWNPQHQVCSMILGLLWKSSSRVAKFGLVVAFVACSSGGSEGEENAERSRLAAATSRLCDRSECRGDYTLDECNFYFLYDSLQVALLATDPDGCVSDFATFFECLGDATSCKNPPECGEYPQLGSSRCAAASDPHIDSPFVGSESFCERQVACYADQLDGPDEITLEEQECLASFEAASLTRAQVVGRSCADAHEALLECTAAAQLACTSSAEDEQAVCPDEVAALENACDR